MHSQFRWKVSAQDIYIHVQNRMRKREETPVGRKPLRRSWDSIWSQEHKRTRPDDLPSLLLPRNSPTTSDYSSLFFISFSFLLFVFFSLSLSLSLLLCLFYIVYTLYRVSFMSFYTWQFVFSSHFIFTLFISLLFFYY